MNPAAFKAAERAFQALTSRHGDLCEELQRAEDRARDVDREVDACDVRCAELRQGGELAGEVKEALSNWGEVMSSTGFLFFVFSFFHFLLFQYVSASCLSVFL